MRKRSVIDWVIVGLALGSVAAYFFPVMKAEGASFNGWGMSSLLSMAGSLPSLSGLAIGLQLIVASPVVLLIYVGAVTLFTENRVMRMVNIAAASIAMVTTGWFFCCVWIISNAADFVEEFSYGTSEPTVSMGIGLILELLCALALVILSIISASQLTKPELSYPRQNTEPDTEEAMCIQFIDGELAGYRFPIHKGEALAIGRDAQKVNIVIENSKISRRHCQVMYAGDGMFRIGNWSANGTLINDVEKLPVGMAKMVPQNTVISLAGGAARFRLSKLNQ